MFCSWQASASAFERVRVVRRGVDDVVVGQLAGEHAEAVVVLARDGDVAHAGLLGQLDPGLGIESGRVETRGELGVLADRELVVVHDPLALGQERVDAPVDEQAELGILEPPPGRRVALGQGRRAVARGAGAEAAGRQGDGHQDDARASFRVRLDRPAHPARRNRSPRRTPPFQGCARASLNRRRRGPGPFRYDRRRGCGVRLRRGPSDPADQIG